MQSWRRRAYQLGLTYGLLEGPTNRQALLYAIKRATRGLPSRQAAIAVTLARRGYQDGAIALVECSLVASYCSGCGAGLEEDGNFCGHCGLPVPHVPLQGGLVGNQQRFSDGHVLNRPLGRKRQAGPGDTPATNPASSGAARHGGWRGYASI